MLKEKIRVIFFSVLAVAGGSANATPVTSGLELWLSADSLDQSTTVVSTWKDQSGNGRDATSTVAGNSPTYVSSNTLFSDHATVSFDGNDVLSSALASVMNIDGNNARTMFFVFSQDAGNSRNIFGYGTNTGSGLFDVAAAGQRISGHFYGGPFINGTQTFATNQRTVGAVRYDGSTFDTFQHDVSVNAQTSSTAYSINTGDSAFRIGGGMYSAYNNFNGDIAELLVYSSVLSNTEILSVDNYLNVKYSTAPATVSEPGTLALMGIAFLGFVIRKHKVQLS